MPDEPYIVVLKLELLTGPRWYGTAEQRLRWLLKFALRMFGFKCLEITRETVAK